MANDETIAALERAMNEASGLIHKSDERIIRAHIETLRNGGERAQLVKRLIHTREYHAMMYDQYEAVTEAAAQIEADGKRISELQSLLRDCNPESVSWLDARDAAIGDEQ